MKSMLLAAIAFTGCAVLTADANDGSAADAVSGVGEFRTGYARRLAAPLPVVPE